VDEKILKQFLFIMGLFLLFLFLLIFLGGCAKPERTIVYETFEVKVPISEIPALKPIYIPELPVNSLDENSTPGTVVSAYYNTVELLKRHIMLLEIQLKPFWNEHLKSKP
jgi:hypothetical protein